LLVGGSTSNNILSTDVVILTKDIYLEQFFLSINFVSGVRRLDFEKSGVPQGNLLDSLLFLTYVNGIWRNTESAIRLFADSCIIYREIVNNKDVENLQTDLNRLGEWAVEYAMAINPGKSKAVCFTRARVTGPLNYSLRDIVIPEASCCK
jgi:hypothetical protein